MLHSGGSLISLTNTIWSKYKLDKLEYSKLETLTKVLKDSAENSRWIFLHSILYKFLKLISMQG